MRRPQSCVGYGSLLLAVAFAAPAAHAEFFAGASIGSATVALEPEIADFDENDNSWKLFGGYLFDVAVLDIGIEGGYVNLGSPSNSLGSLDTSAIDLFAVLGFDFSLVGVFGKAGMVAWESDVSDGPFRYDEDGTDLAYGVGLKFALASFAIRAEYELFDIEDADDVNMISVGLAWHF